MTPTYIFIASRAPLIRLPDAHLKLWMWIFFFLIRLIFEILFLFFIFLTALVSCNSWHLAATLYSCTKNEKIKVCVWSSKSHQTESATWWIDLSSVLTVPELVLPCGYADSSLESCFSRMVHEVRTGSMWHQIHLVLIDRWFVDFENVSFLSVGYSFTSVM